MAKKVKFMNSLSMKGIKIMFSRAYTLTKVARIILPESCFSRTHFQSCFTNLNGIGTLQTPCVESCFSRETSVYCDSRSARSCGIWSYLMAFTMVFWMWLVKTTSTAILVSFENCWHTFGSILLVTGNNHHSSNLANFRVLNWTLRNI